MDVTPTSPKVSIVTAVYDCRDTIAGTIESVRSQSYDNIEYIVIDGASTDGTLDVLHAHSEFISTFVSEPDAGIYDALNKGISLATGDIIGLLHADDFYAYDDAIADVARAFRPSIEAVFADIVFVEARNPDKTVRYYSSKGFDVSQLARGMMPAHPSLFVRRSVYERLGPYSLEYEIASDFDMVVRMFAGAKISYAYLNKVLVKMRRGGLSTRSWRSNLLLNREILSICRRHGIDTNMLKIYSKYFTKVLGLIRPGSALR